MKDEAPMMGVTLGGDPTDLGDKELGMPLMGLTNNDEYAFITVDIHGAIYADDIPKFIATLGLAVPPESKVDGEIFTRFKCKKTGDVYLIKNENPRSKESVLTWSYGTHINDMEKKIEELKKENRELQVRLRSEDDSLSFL